jgi:hypothetical protein
VITEAIAEDALGAVLRVLPEGERRQRMRGPDHPRSIQHRVQRRQREHLGLRAADDRAHHPGLLPGQGAYERTAGSARELDAGPDELAENSK